MREAPDEAGLAIEAAGLTRRYDERLAVDHLDLGVGQGEIYGFLGPNGAGKSTAVRMLCTLLRPSEGTAGVAGLDVAQEPLEVRRRIGVALQDAALDEGQTGRELLLLQGRLYGLWLPEIRGRLDEVLDLVAIGDAIDRRIKTYSGGMKRRLDLAASLVHGPEVLFLDEPTTGWTPRADSPSRRRSVTSTPNCRMTIFLTTQYLEEADGLADASASSPAGASSRRGHQTELKRSTARTSSMVEAEGDDPGPLGPRAPVAVVDGVHADAPEVTIGTLRRAGAIAPLAICWAAPLMVGLTVRTPTLDDVFLK